MISFFTKPASRFVGSEVKNYSGSREKLVSLLKFYDDKFRITPSPAKMKSTCPTPHNLLEDVAVNGGSS
jgi:hypothetical protein